VVPALFFLYFYGLDGAGLLGPDEPRYAAIGREMARSGDWITPRLWGDAWFEKPALLYWMTAGAFRAGLGEDLAPRLPVALVSVAFLVFYQRLLERRFGAAAGWFAAVMLGTSAGWLAYSHIGVTDLPMAAAFSVAMLLALDWVERGETRVLPWVSGWLGVAVLAKGLVPLVLAAPLLWFGRRRLLDWLRPQAAAPFFLIALPWYLLCYLRNGPVFLQKFFWEHHFERFATDSLQHQQPFWFYVPVLVGALLPWSPVLVLLVRRSFYRDAARRFLALWVVFGFLFFSLSTNKLPGYLLPLLPGAAALMGLALAEAVRARALLAAGALSLAAIPFAVAMLPRILAVGLSRAGSPAFDWTWALPPAVGAAVWWLESRRHRGVAVAVMGLAVTAGVAELQVRTIPVLDRTVSAQPLWREIADRRDEVCMEPVHRNIRYGLNYYAVTPLPDCRDSPRPLVVRQSPGHPPTLARRLDPS
jgi:4-amino-4-deoxy-L-arabinose transferase-like glycosyltransferase